MKITKRDLTVILYLTGIALAFVAYQFYFKTKMEDADALDQQSDALQITVDDLKEKDAHKAEYQKNIDDYREKIDTIAKTFQPEISHEDTIMYVKELLDTQDVLITQLKMTDPSVIYVVAGTGTASGYSMMAQNNAMSFEYATHYNGLKNLLNAIYNSKEMQNIEAFTIKIDNPEDELSFDPSGNLIEDVKLSEEEEEEKEKVLQLRKEKGYTISGEITLNRYTMTNNGLEHDPLPIPEMDHGVVDLFRSGTGTPETEAEE
ncbi:MAG: hypothetical protein J5757_05480 [Lachnospiraceae bacterium]|nr:hypothetical protein [Lachnospiraceae bacterium]